MRAPLLVATLLGGVILGSGLARADGREVNTAAPALFSWTGMYLGYHSGAAIGSATFSDPFGPSVFGDTVRTPGGLVGMQAGVNGQSGSTVFGIEFDVSAADLDGTNTCFAFSSAYVSSNCHVRTNYMGTLTGRLGVAVGAQGRTLIYGKAGAAFESSQLNAQPNFTGLLLPSSANNGPKFGWTVGAGIEHALIGNWSVKAEYDYLAFGDTRFTVPVSAFNPAAPVLVASVNPSSVSQDIHQFKIGVNYKLGADPGNSDPIWHHGSVKDAAVRPVPGFEVEVGGRYAYGWGRFQKDIGLTKTSGAPPNMLVSRLTYDDMKTDSGEVFARIDTPWNLMAKGFIGGGTGKNGKMNDEDWGIGGALGFYSNTLAQPVRDDITYGAVDVGYDWLRGRGYKLASFIGYTQFKSDMAAFGCLSIAAANCPSPGTPNTGSPNITESDTWSALRLGSSAQFMIVHGLRANIDAAYLAYVQFKGTDHHNLGNSGVLAEVFPEKGTGSGVQLEGTLSYDVTPNISFGVGGRYWAMWTTEGTVNCTFGAGGLCAGFPTPPQYFRAAVEQASVLFQASYKFGASPVMASGK